MDQIWRFITAMDLSFPRGIIGSHFGDVVGILSILFGGTLLLFAWKHHDYFLGVSGFLAGAFLGLLFKAHVVPAGGMAHFLYIVVCGLGMAAVLLMFKRMVGIALGGFITALVVGIVRPEWLSGARASVPMLALVFLLGGGLGAIFPRLFYILTTSLLGAAFVTYGITEVLVPLVLADVASGIEPRVLHSVVFFPLFVFGIGYQVFTTREEPPPALRPKGDPATVPAA